MRTEQVRVRLSEDNSEYLRKLAEESGLQQIEIATMLLHAAISALRQAGQAPPFPVRFEIANKANPTTARR